MLHRITLMGLLFAFAVPSLGVTLAQERSFPYQATVATDDIEVRCGPGARYYATSKLKAGTRLAVHRHDHGGWFMIAPPPGSFSWIDAELVDVQGDRGTVQVATTADGQAARAIVRIGSELSDDHAFYGRQLSNGDQVRILGRRTLQTDRGAREMLQIEPPAQEFRWIKGDFVVPIDVNVRDQQANDPYQIPPQHRPKLSRDLVLAEETTPVVTAQTDLDMGRSPSAMQLALLDQQYAEMMSLQPREWNLDGMAAAYQQLQQSADTATGDAIAQRLRVIDSRRAVFEQFQRFMQITNETSQRDSQLALQQGGSSPQIAYGNFSTATPVPTLAVTQSAPIASESMPQTADAGGTVDDVQPRLNGAGIVQPIGRPGLPPFALVAPDGRFLAYLEPADAGQLQGWIGKEAGVIGQRQFDPQLNADLIRVRRLTSVKLVP